MMPKFIQVWKQDFRLCWSFVSKQTLQRNLSKSRRTSALSMARPWKFVRITVAFWERKVILNEQWPFSGGVSFPSVFIAEIMPYGVISVFILGRYFPTVLQTDFDHRPKKIDAPHFATQGIRNSNLKHRIPKRLKVYWLVQHYVRQLLHILQQLRFG